MASSDDVQPPPQAEARILVAPSKPALSAVLSAQIALCCRSALSSRDAFSIALSGGSLPSLLGELSHAFEKEGVDPHWDRWHVLLADERCVPPSHEHSNLGAIRRNFTDAVPIPRGQVYGIDEALLSGPTERMASDYEGRVVRPLLDRCSGMLDCAVLGFGPDGHTCSLFPNHALLEEKTRLVASIDDSPKPPPSRITLTLPVLNKLCRHVVFCGAGSSKTPILKAVFEKAVLQNADPATTNAGDARSWRATLVDPAPVPCGMVRPCHDVSELVWVVDAGAAEGAFD